MCDVFDLFSICWVGTVNVRKAICDAALVSTGQRVQPGGLGQAELVAGFLSVPHELSNKIVPSQDYHLATRKKWE